MPAQTENTNDTPAVVLPEGDTFAPNAVAELLFGKDGSFQGGKRVRAFLRATYTRPADAKGKTWTIDRTVAQATVDHFLALRTSATVTADDANDAK